MIGALSISQNELAALNILVHTACADSVFIAIFMKFYSLNVLFELVFCAFIKNICSQICRGHGSIGVDSSPRLNKTVIFAVLS